MSDKRSQPDAGAQRSGKGTSKQERTKNQPQPADPTKAAPKGPKHGHGRGSGGGV